MMSIQLLIVVLSLLAVHVAGIAAGRKGSKDFVLAGRSLNVPMLVATLVATWYGAILASGEFVLRYGIVFILCFGVPYYAVAILYSTWLSRRVRDQQSASIPEQIGRAYGPAARRVAAVLLLVITVPASYQLMLGHLISYELGWPLTTSVIVATIISVSYVLIGGLRSDVFANVLQSILMFVGMGLLIVASFGTFGSPVALRNETTAPLFNIPGSLGWGGVLSWFVIAMQTFIDPNFYVRTASASSASVARRAILWSVACWVVFDLLQLLGGLYAARFLPGVDPRSSYLALSSATLPAWGQGVVLAGIVAAISSTLSGYALVSATMIADEVLPMFRGVPGGTAYRNRIGLVVTSVIGAVVAINVPSFIDLIFNASSIVVSALLFPVIISHTRRITDFRQGIIVAMVIPALAALTSIVIDVGQPAMIGLSASVLVHLFQFMQGARRS
ncbi:MAG: hypothetical protein FGM33_07495 [Candidatus Kapabacteria bacterium]|nr:hypothetical protein [Candidatus Kapabacteria bacterium]